MLKTRKATSKNRYNVETDTSKTYMSYVLCFTSKLSNVNFTFLLGVFLLYILSIVHKYSQHLKNFKNIF